MSDQRHLPAQNSHESFEKLEVWQKSKDAAVRVCRLTRDWRDFGLRDQMSRSAVSIPSNIAEGAERLSRAEFRQFLGYAKGSAGELRTQLCIAEELGYLDAEIAQSLRDELIQISRMIHGLIRSLPST